MADANYRLTLYTRLPGAEGRELLQDAAEVAASVAAEVLAYGDEFGNSAAVEYTVQFNERSVPAETRDVPNVVEFEYPMAPVEVMSDSEDSPE